MNVVRKFDCSFLSGSIWKRPKQWQLIDPADNDFLWKRLVARFFYDARERTLVVQWHGAKALDCAIHGNNAYADLFAENNSCFVANITTTRVSQKKLFMVGRFNNNQ